MSNQIRCAPITPDRAIFYHRDSEGHSELTPAKNVEWAAGVSSSLELKFRGTPTQIDAMVKRGVPYEDDLYLDFGVSGNLMSRTALDAFIQRAMTDTTVRYLLIPRRDRLFRPDNPIEAATIEVQLRMAGLTMVWMNAPPATPIQIGQRIDMGDLIRVLFDYDASGKFRQDLADKLIRAKLALANWAFPSAVNRSMVSGAGS